MAIGNRIFLKRKLADPQVIEAFKEIPAANVADTMNRSCALDSRIHLMSRPQKSATVGSALTVKVRAGDNLFLHKALDMAQEGDVIVVSNEGDTNRALMGEVMISLVNGKKKIAGIVLDGAIRDSDQIGKMDFFLYATGATPGGPYKSGPGEINVPISCGGMVVNPGDVVLADTDGVIIIPRDQAEKVLRDAQEYMIKDQNKLAAAQTGHSNRAWVSELLDVTNCEIIDGYYE